MYVLELGGQDDAFAAAEARAAAAGVEVVAPGLATAEEVDVGRVRGLAYTRRAGVLVGRTAASVGAARAVLEAHDIDRSGTVAVRARDVRGTAGIDTRRAERELGAVLTARGFTVDLESPAHELRALFSDDTCLLAWLAVEGVRDFGDRSPTEKPFFQPGSMDPLDARALVNLARAGPGRTVLDPMCGTGGILVEAGLVGAAVVGVDARDRMVRGARRNLEHYLETDVTVLVGDAGRLPVRDDAVDVGVFDAPYGRQSPIASRDLESLMDAALAEIHRVADRAVVVGDRSWEAAAATAGWTVEVRFERRVHRSLVRHVHVLVRNS